MTFQPTNGRIPRFASTRGGGVTLFANDAEGISLAEIAERAPSVFAQAKHESRSERYVFGDTTEVVRGLISEGFIITEVRQGGSRDEAKVGFTKHLLRLRHRSTGLVEARPGDLNHSEVVLLNSHDGTSSYRLMGGVFRMLCSNGMFAGDLFADYRVGHTRKHLREEVIEAAFSVVEQFPAITDSLREMTAIDLSRDEQMAFATAARELRWENRPAQVIEGELVPAKVPPIAAETLLNANRAYDQGPDLWRTMNRVQENIMRGGQRYTIRSSTGRRQRREVGAVNGIDQNSNINRALWTLAEEMKKRKAA